jgi:hypothetical protein
MVFTDSIPVRALLYRKTKGEKFKFDSNIFYNFAGQKSSLDPR